MSDAANLSFVASRMPPSEVAGKDVIELGSLIVDDTCREYVLSLKPASYIGVDMRPGPGVDLVCDVRDAPAKLRRKFDVVLSTAMLEHCGDFHGAIVAMKKFCRPGTKLFVTVPTIGFRFHAHPHDHWRPTLNDFAQLFADCEILELVEDYDGAQIMMKAVATEHTGRTPVIPIYNVVYERPMLPLSEQELGSRQYARLARIRMLKVGVQDIMGATALFLGISLPHRKAPPQAARAPTADRVALATKTDA